MFIIKDHSEICEACFERAGSLENKDLLICSDFNTLPIPYGKGMIRIVLDGMSHGDGKEAAQIAADSLLNHLVGRFLSLSRRMAALIEADYDDPVADSGIQERIHSWVFDILCDALHEANDALTASEYPRPYCTVSIAVVFHRHIYTANLGDSPIYLLNLASAEPTLTPLFVCDNEAGQEVANGKLTEEEALHSPQASMLNLFLGWRNDDLLADAHYMHTPLPQSCILMLGSDGSLAQLLRSEMAHTVIHHLSGGLSAVQEELRLLVGESGSTDDFSLVMDWIESD